MILSAIACFATAVSGLQAKPVMLERVFTKGEKGKCEVHSYLSVESRQLGLETWIPDDLELLYTYNYEIKEMKADGICVMRYQRPTMTEIHGETADSGPRSIVEKVNFNLELDVSPANEVLKVKDLNPPKKDDKKPPTRDKFLAAMKAGGKVRQDTLSQFLGQFVGEIYRLALFAGSLDSSLDFNPKLPFDEVKVGETWKRTVGYSPQKSRGTDKMAVQRMDYTYTYKGQMDVNGKKIERVTADVELKTDLAEFIHQTFNVKSSETGLKEVPLTFKSHIDFDLDPKTFRTIKAYGDSEGGFRIIVTQMPNQAVQEERLRGRVTMKVIQ